MTALLASAPPSALAHLRQVAYGHLVGWTASGEAAAEAVASDVRERRRRALAAVLAVDPDVSASDAALVLGVEPRLVTLLFDELAVERLALTYAPMPRRTRGGLPGPVRASAVALHARLVGAGRSVQRATLLVAHLFAVSPATVDAWRRDR